MWFGMIERGFTGQAAMYTEVMLGQDYKVDIKIFYLIQG